LDGYFRPSRDNGKTMTESEPATKSPPKSAGRFRLLIILGSVVAVPVATFIVMQIVNATVFECRNGGAEDSLSCVLRTVVITAMSIPFGAVAGFFAAMWVGKRE
jgi:hypothetical protein